MKIKKGQQLELTIQDLAFGGRGLAKVDGLAVFVDQAVPEDRVMARIGKKRKSYAEARVVELIEPSPLRVNPPCPYSGTCGGCKWQFLGYDHQLVYKRRHVAEAYAHIGGIKDVTVHPTIASDKVFAYRNKMEFSCAERRWLMPADLDRDDIERGFALGLHVPGTFYKVLDIDACLLQQDLGNHILNDVKAYIRTSSQPVYGLRSHQGFWRFLMLRHSVARDQWMVNLITASEDIDAVQPLADQLMDAYPEIASVVNNVTASKGGVAIGEFERLLAGSDCLHESIGPFEFRISANSFFQTNTRGAARLYEVVERYAGLSGTETVLDLYCGAGTIAIYLAAQARRVVGLELVVSAIADARHNCRHNRIDNCEFVEGDLRETLPGIDAKPDVMIIDPPRAGMHQDVVAGVLAMAPPKIVYVSCNPATMARDVALMAEDYHVVEVQPVDMFPHTFHIEAVGRLERKR